MAMDDRKRARLDALLDKQDITEALTRLSRGMDRLDRELYLSAFHADAEMAAGPFVGLASECADWAFPMHEEGQILTHHALLNITIDRDGDTAAQHQQRCRRARHHRRGRAAARQRGGVRQV